MNRTEFAKELTLEYIHKHGWTENDTEIFDLWFKYFFMFAPRIDRTKRDEIEDCYCQDYPGYMCLKHSKEFRDNYEKRLKEKRMKIC